MGDSQDVDDDDLSEDRLLQWNVETLLDLVRKIAARREIKLRERQPGSVTAEAKDSFRLKTEATYLEEVAEIIHLPKDGVDLDGVNVESCHIDSQIVKELTELVRRVAQMYKVCTFDGFLNTLIRFFSFEI